MKIILGSTSISRKEILDFFSLPFEQISPNFDESSLDKSMPCYEFTQLAAKEKAKSLAKQFPKDLIITADTVGWIENDILLKPTSYDEAFRMLKRLSGKIHEVTTGLCVLLDSQIELGYEVTKVYFQSLSDTQIKKYLENIDFLSKSGSYSLQKSGSLVIKKIDGSFYNVVGLPITLLHNLLLKVKVDLWDHLKPL